jgi:Protein kinase domain
MGNPAEFIGRQIGRYRIVRHLASGGMAELYIARQEAMGGFEKEIVLKMLQGRYAEHPRVVSMFLDEARLAAKLNHPSIVHVYDVADEDGVKYIAMEYIHGETLIDIIKRGIAVDRYLPLEHAVHVVRQSAAGLAYAHGRREPDGRLLRIVHRDVSPTNILVSYEGQTKIVDFGIARIQDELRDESGIRPGKSSYMSPEQVRGEGADYRSDIFSLGIILYEITVGQRLYRGPAAEVMTRIVEDKILPPTAVKRDFPPALELIVMRALEKRPDDRYQSAEEMRVDLEEFLADEGLRTGTRRMGMYMNEIFAPESPVSSAGVEAARGYGEAAARPVEESEELNFDRRAPLSMRFEAAPATAERNERPTGRYRPPVPGELQPLPPPTLPPWASSPTPPPGAEAAAKPGARTNGTSQKAPAGDHGATATAGTAPPAAARKRRPSGMGPAESDAEALEAIRKWESAHLPGGESARHNGQSDRSEPGATGELDDRLGKGAGKGVGRRGGGDLGQEVGDYPARGRGVWLVLAAVVFLGLAIMVFLKSK